MTNSGGVMCMTGDGREVACFTEDRGSPPVEHTSAIVIWRIETEWTRTSLWHRLTAWMRPRVAEARREFPRWDPDWDAASDPGGPREVLHSRQRHEIRIQGTVYPAPTSEDTPVWLIDARASVPHVHTHAVRIPPRTTEHRPGRRFAREQIKTLVRVLEDPIIAAFLTRKDDAR